MQKKTFRVLAFCETNTKYGREILEGVSQFAREKNWILSFEQRGRFELSFDRYLPSTADGIISRTIHFSANEILEKSGVPFVELMGAVPRNQNGKKTLSRKKFSDIGTDENALAKMIADHFIERGLRQFAYYDMENVPMFYPRRNAYLEYLSSLDYSCHVYPSTWTCQDCYFPQWHEKYRKRLSKWLLALPKPIGLFASLDQCGQIVLELCQELGIRVPQEISLVAVGNDKWICRMMNPAMSSVNCNSFAVGYLAAALLEKKMRHEPIASNANTGGGTTVQPQYLAIRQSSDFYSVGDPDIEKALLFIRENACNRIQLKDILNEVIISQRTLYRGFDKYIHRTPQAEILRVQMEEAKCLLRETQFSIACIARRTGFSNAIYFIQVFRRECGMTPNVYRIQNRFGSVMEEY
ncbi:MAG: substrate-binding domain-containing protein [Planctomycetia bacterium]|nr:substrate-binding domain-containing protein [Planctomycetia bacterium]